MNYPFQTQFKLYLAQAGKASITIDNYDAAIQQFFIFLTSSRSPAPQLSRITENDVRAYLAALQESGGTISLSTYNKVLSQLNTYFSYLLSHQLIQSLPTLTIHGQAVEPNRRINLKWLHQLPAILADHQLHFYTRMTLLLCSHGFTVNEFLQPGFEKVWSNFNLSSHDEQAFWQAFQQYIKPLQKLQQSQQLFLKQRYQPAHPGLSNAGLHKYLSKDEQLLGFSCSPKYLHQAYIIHNLQMNPTSSPQELEAQLRLDPASLLYYQRLILQL